MSGLTGHFPSITLTPSHKDARNDDGDDGLERIALRLLNALPPTPQMLEIRPQAVEHARHTTKSPRRIAPRGPFRIFLDGDNVPVICPTCQTLTKMQQNQLGGLKPILQKLPYKNRKPAAAFTARAL
jgi:hypothetical protein